MQCYGQCTGVDKQGTLARITSHWQKISNLETKKYKKTADVTKIKSKSKVKKKQIA